MTFKALILAISVALASTAGAYSQYRAVSRSINGIELRPQATNNGYEVWADDVHNREYLYHRGTGFVEIPNPQPSSNTRLGNWNATNVTTNGMVYGIYRNSDFFERPYTWTRSGGFNFNYDWRFPGDTDFYLDRTNNVGQFIGSVQDNNPFIPYGAALWHPDGTMTRPNVALEDINDDGIIAGENAQGKAVIHRPDGTEQILRWPTFGNQGLPYSAISISSTQVIGRGVRPDNSTDLMVWNMQGQVMRSIHTAPFQDVGGGPYINDNGLAAFSLPIGNNVYHSYLWSPTESPVDINSILLPNSLRADEYLYRAWGPLDEDGRLVAWVRDSSNYRFVLLEPVPEPASLSVFALGLVPFLRRRKR